MDKAIKDRLTALEASVRVMAICHALDQCDHEAAVWLNENAKSTDMMWMANNPALMMKLVDSIVSSPDYSIEMFEFAKHFMKEYASRYYPARDELITHFVAGGTSMNPDYAGDKYREFVWKEVRTNHNVLRRGYLHAIMSLDPNRMYVYTDLLDEVIELDPDERCIEFAKEAILLSKKSLDNPVQSNTIK